MCIIAYGLKKNLKRSEIAECMRSNSSGFFMVGIRPDSSIVEPVRTLDRNKIFEYYSSKLEDDDKILFHARIPSCGGTSLDNVHGWEENGVYFCHNGTMSSLAKWGDHTDSETFFRRIFMPCWRGEGKKFTDNVEYVVEHFLGSYNKFAFLLPNGEVKLYGKFVEDHGCKFSNETYKPYSPSTYASSYQQDYWEDSYSPVGSQSAAPHCKYQYQTYKPATIKLDGSTMTGIAKPMDILKFSMYHYLACCATAASTLPEGFDIDPFVETNMHELAVNLFSQFTKGPEDMAADVIDMLTSLDFVSEYDKDKAAAMADFVSNYAEMAESWVITPGYATTKKRIENALRTATADVASILGIYNVVDLNKPVVKTLADRFYRPVLSMKNPGTAKASVKMAKATETDLFDLPSVLVASEVRNVIVPSFKHIANVEYRTRLAAKAIKKEGSDE